jgi:hypothetical protein
MLLYACLLIILTSSISGSVIIMPMLTLLLSHLAWSSLPILAYLLFLVYVGGLLVLLSYILTIISFSTPHLPTPYLLPLLAFIFYPQFSPVLFRWSSLLLRSGLLTFIVLLILFFLVGLTELLISAIIFRRNYKIS